MGGKGTGLWGISVTWDSSKRNCELLLTDPEIKFRGDVEKGVHGVPHRILSADRR